MSGRSGYLGTSRGRRLLDLSEPTPPTEAGVYAPRRGVDHVAVGPPYAYLTTRDRLDVGDVGDPARPAMLGADTGLAGSVALLGNHVYLHASETLRVLDAADPANPRYSGLQKYCSAALKRGPAVYGGSWSQ